MPFLPPSLHFISPSSSGQRINFLFSFDLCYPYFFSLSPIREFYQVFPFFFPCLYSFFFAIGSTGLRFFLSRGRLSHTLCDGQVGGFFFSLFLFIFPWYHCFPEYIHLCSSFSSFLGSFIASLYLHKGDRPH